MPAFIAEAPARIKAGHVQDHNLGIAAGSAKGYRNKNEHPLTAALDAEKIGADEFAAGEMYRVLFEQMGRSGRDSLEMVSGSGSRTPFTDAQVNAIRTIEKIEQQLKLLTPKHTGEPWLTIIRHFCGEGWSARDACVKARIGDPRQTWESVRLALNKLSTAISRTRVDFFGKRE